MKSRHIALQLTVGLVAGVLTGWHVHSVADAGQSATISARLSVITGMFLRLVKMIVAPLILATLIAGVARAGSGASMGRLGLRTLTWFIGASLISLTLGLIMANLLQPGAGFDASLAQGLAAPTTSGSPIDLQTFALHLVPRSLFEALAKNDILQIVVFSLFAGIGLAAMGPKGSTLLRACESLADLMLVVTGYVMKSAPLAVFVAMVACVATGGLGRLLLTFYLALLLLWILMATVALITLRRARTLALLRGMREPVMLAFATASSEAAYPSMLVQLERLGVPKPIASFVLPLDYSFNLDGSMLYCAFALLFISQAFGVPLTITQQLGMLLLLMVMSKGMAGVPRASLIVLATALPHLPLPEAGLALLIGVDQLLDMGRTATNVFGNSLAAAVVADWQRDSAAQWRRPHTRYAPRPPRTMCTRTSIILSPLQPCRPQRLTILPASNGRTWFCLRAAAFAPRRSTNTRRRLRSTDAASAKEFVRCVASGRDVAGVRAEGYRLYCRRREVG